MTNFQEMMNPSELTKHSAQIMNGMMDKGWETYDAQREGINHFNQKMYEMIGQTIAAAKTHCEPITSKMLSNNVQPFMLIDQMVEQTKSAHESLLNMSDSYVKQIKSSMYKAIEKPSGVCDSSSYSLSSNTVAKSYMDLAKQAEGFFKMPWLKVANATNDTEGKETPVAVSAVKKNAAK